MALTMRQENAMLNYKANGGNMRKVAKNTFIIVARGVDVMGELLPEEFEDGKIYF